MDTNLILPRGQHQSLGWPFAEGARAQLNPLVAQLNIARPRFARLPLRPRLPIHPVTRLKNGPLEGWPSGSGRDTARFGRPGERTAETFAKRMYPRHRKPYQRDRLKGNAETECGLIGGYRIMPVLRRPLSDYDPNAVLNHERPAEVQEVESAVGARGKFLGEIIGYGRKA